MMQIYKSYANLQIANRSVAFAIRQIGVYSHQIRITL